VAALGGVGLGQGRGGTAQQQGEVGVDGGAVATARKLAVLA